MPEDPKKKLLDALTLLAALQAQGSDRQFAEATDRAENEAHEAARAYARGQKDS